MIMIAGVWSAAPAELRCYFRKPKRFAILGLLCTSQLLGEADQHVRSVRVTVLSPMLADAGIGEWGFSALVEADGRRILFDTGARPDTVLKNAWEMGVDLANVTELILSHSHADHTGGFIALRRELAKSNPAALSRTHVGKGIFLSRVSPAGTEGNILTGAHCTGLEAVYRLRQVAGLGRRTCLVGAVGSS